MATQILRRQTSIETSEREIVDHLAAYANEYPREGVVNYYVSLKTNRFVILTGPPEVDKTYLVQKLADILVGRSSFQRCRFQAHPWWTMHTGAPARFAGVHAQFNFLKLLNCIEAASVVEAGELPFFVTIEHMSPAEVECYFHDLPRGLLWRADGSTVQIHLPRNLYVTGTLDVEGTDSFALSQEVYRYATVIQVDHNHFALSAGPDKTSQRRPDWQLRFVSSVVRRSDQAEIKLARVLPDGVSPLAPLNELERRFQIADFPPFVLERAQLYLANAFDSNGRGLFVKPTIENLRIAQDYVLVQCVLPHLRSQWAEGPRMWEEVREYFALRFPRAFQTLASRWQTYLRGADFGPKESRATVPATEAGG